MGSSALEVMITATAAASLNMYCRGGDGCCGREDTRWGAATLLALALVSRLCVYYTVQAVLHIECPGCAGGGGGLRR